MSADAKTVLVVDDSSTVRKMMEWVLKKAGYAVVQAADGREALAVVAKQAVHLVFCDLNMPVMDGITFVKSLRALPDPKTLPVVMLTTEQREQDVQLARDAGVNDYLNKPCTPEAILAKAKAFLEAPK